jgi:ABC-type sugar transport system ATPase subunit
MIGSLTVKNVSKSFRGVHALKDVSFTIRGGQINCLVGENGAGKSTIIKVLAGYHKPDDGQIFIDDHVVVFNNPRDSKKHGISVIHQELLLVPHLSVAENICLGQWPKNGRKTVDWKGMSERARKSLAMLGANIDPETIVSTLSTGEQQLVEIARSLSMKTDVLILDEPTASLSETEAQRLLKIVRSLRDQGLAILYVSHRLEEVFELADMITVFRDGQMVRSDTKQEITPGNVVRLMVGRDVSLERTRQVKRGNKVLEVKNLTRGTAVRNVSFDLHQGEILGLGGLVGAGRTEIFRLLFGVDKKDAGEIRIDGKQVEIGNCVDAIRHGIGLVPEDRKTQGLVLSGSVKENVSLSILNRVKRLGWINHKQEKQVVQSYKDKLRIKTPSLDTLVLSLSGGNQQKVVLARWLATDPKILLLDEPTRGVDVGARAEIQKMIENLVSQGLAIIIISSDIMELLAMSDRVIVIKEGRAVAELSGDNVTKEEVLKYATGTDS